MNYEYHLQKYAGTASRHTCPIAAGSAASHFMSMPQASPQTKPLVDVTTNPAAATTTPPASTSRTTPKPEPVRTIIVISSEVEKSPVIPGPTGNLSLSTNVHLSTRPQRWTKWTRFPPTS